MLQFNEEEALIRGQNEAAESCGFTVFARFIGGGR